MRATSDPPREATIRVNGRDRSAGAGLLEPLLKELGYATDRPGIAVAVNGEVVPRRAWGTRRVRAGDEIDVVGAVQGG
jgi:sulfur carrier protein